MSRFVVAGLAFLGVLFPVCAAEPAKPADSDESLFKTASSLYDGITVKTLANGLKVYLKPIPSSPVVTTMMAYRVGASDEELDQTGLSHYLEHLMFKGTDKLHPGDIDRLTQRNAGQNNAYTTEDMTVYHFDFANDRWMIALQIEADRMRNTRVDAKHEFQQEKGAVIQELSRNEDRPWDLENKMLVPLLFGDEVAVRPSGDRREKARGGHDRGNHHATLRSLVLPEQCIADHRRRLRRKRGAGNGREALQQDSQGGLAGAEAEHRAPEAQGDRAEKDALQVRNAPAGHGVQHGRKRERRIRTPSTYCRAFSPAARPPGFTGS